MDHLNCEASAERAVSERSAAAIASLKSAMPPSGAQATESAEQMDQYKKSAQIFRSALWKVAHDFENSKSKTDQRLGHVLIALGYALDELNGQTDIDTINTQVKRYVEQNWAR